MNFVANKRTKLIYCFIPNYRNKNYFISVCRVKIGQYSISLQNIIINVDALAMGISALANHAKK